MDTTARRGFWRLVLAPLIALALIVGYGLYLHVGPGESARHFGAPAPAAKAPAVKKLTSADLLLAASTARGIYLQFDGVTGVPGTVHTNHAAITSFQWGVGSQPPPIGGSGGGASKPSVSQITMTKSTDRYSLPLLKDSLKRSPVLNAVVYFTGVTTGGTAVDYLEFDLKNAYVTGYSMSSGGDTPSESVSLYFTAITIKAHIAGAPAQTVSYNLATNLTS